MGRERELAALQVAIDHALAGRGRTLLVVGPAGIGKTRLVEEALAAASPPAARVFWARCPDQSGAPAFWPWRRVLRALLEPLADDA
ncbi:MAG: hypothetical protein DCC71_25970, partial [Proteobacteria bacterium]